MVSKISSALALVAAVLPFVTAHGQPEYVEVNGQRYDAPNIYYDGDAKNANTPIRKAYRSDAQAFVYQQDFGDASKMACEGAGGAPGSIKLNAGDYFTWKWAGATTELQNAGYGEQAWVHGQGTVADYIAECTNGDCTSFDASQAGWTKLDLFGLDTSQSITDQLRNALAAKPEPYRASTGVWGLAKLIQDGSKWTFQVPSSLKAGKYILRSELIALHNPLVNGDLTSGPQLYAGCAQIEVVNGGSTSLPAGTNAGQLYQPWGDFAWFNVMNNNGFTDPGPAVWDQVTGGSSSNNNNNSGSNNSGSNNSSNNSGNDNSQNSGNDNTNTNTGSDNTSNYNTGSDNTNTNTGSTDNNNNSGNNGSTDNSNNGGNTDTTTTDNTNTNTDQNQNQNSGDNSTSTGSQGSSGQCRRRRSLNKRNAFTKRVAAARHAKRSMH